MHKSPSRAKAKGKRLRKGKQFDDDEKASSEPSSDSESEHEEQVGQRKKKTKIKINFSRAKTDEKKECQKGLRGDESEYEYDHRVSPYADDYSKLAGSLNKILGTNKESEDENYFWSVFSSIRIEYGDLRSKSLYSIRKQENTNQK